MNFNSEYLFVFDIETVPDVDAANNLLGKEFEILEEKREALTQYHLDITDGKNDFLRQPFHKVVAVSFLIAKIKYVGNMVSYELKDIRSGGAESSSEYDLIKGFFDTIEKFKPKIVSFNGRTFDVPVMKYRAMKYGIVGDFFHTSETKWEGYNKRYALDWHCDLIDALSDFGASARIKLNEVCSILGFPGKFGVDGSNVTSMFDAGNLKEIRNYCETDVLNTYLVYLRYMHHICKLSTDSYNSVIGDILQFIQSNNKNHFNEFLVQWKKCNGNDFFLK